MFKKDIRNARYLSQKQVEKKETNPVSSSLEVNFGEKKELGRNQMPWHYQNAVFTYELLVFIVIEKTKIQTRPMACHRK